MKIELRFFPGEPFEPHGCITYNYAEGEPSAVVAMHDDVCDVIMRHLTRWTNMSTFGKVSRGKKPVTKYRAWQTDWDALRAAAFKVAPDDITNSGPIGCKKNLIEQ